jgi:transposase InsO family protein
MKLHANARTCPKSRRLIVRRIEEEGWSLAAAAEAAGVSERTAAKWLARWRTEGEAGLVDRSSAPKRKPTQLPADRVKAIEALRRLRMTAAEIAECLEMALSTVSRWLKRIGLGKRSRLEPPEPPNRYERKRPGELIHVDVKKLGRIVVPGHRVTGNRRVRADRVWVRDKRGRSKRGIAGWEFCHVAIDDATRLAYAEVLGDEKGRTAAGFLRRAVAWFSSLGISVERVMSDNGSCYRSAVHAAACRELGLRHLRTQPYRPRTNGKAERFIRTLDDRWAGGALYANSAERSAALSGWLTHYNFTRRHGALGHRPPAARLAELEQRHE